MKSMPFDPYNMEENERPLLWTALRDRDCSTAHRLIAAGAHLDDIIEEDGRTFLHRAAEENDLAMVDFYLDLGCPQTLETFDYISRTPLIWASAYGHTHVVARLLSAGANPNAHDERRIGNTALHEAVRGGHSEIVSVLLRAGGDPTIPGWMAISAVDQAYYKIDGGLESPQALRIQKMLAPFSSVLRDKKRKA
jgi:ankyrin repeat protein